MSDPHPSDRTYVCILGWIALASSFAGLLMAAAHGPECSSPDWLEGAVLATVAAPATAAVILARRAGRTLGQTAALATITVLASMAGCYIALIVATLAGGCFGE